MVRHETESECDLCTPDVGPIVSVSFEGKPRGDCVNSNVFLTMFQQGVPNLGEPN